MFEERFSVSLKPLDASPLAFLGLDSGCSLTKVAALMPEGPDRAQLECCSFKNDDLDAALAWLRQRLPPDRRIIRVTGVGGATFQRRIGEELGARVEVVDEFPAHARGVLFLLKNAEEKAVVIDSPSEAGPSQFPLLVVFIGSGTGGSLVREDGSGQSVLEIVMGGKPLLGLCQALIGTSNYDEVMTLAASGRSESVSILSKDLIARDDPDSPYTRIEPDVVLFPFGKMADGASSAPASREDLALAAVDMAVSAVADAIVPCALRCCRPRVLLCGNATRNAFFRSMLLRRCVNCFLAPGRVRPEFVNCGYTGAIGSMVTGPEVPWGPGWAEIEERRDEAKDKCC